MSTVTKALKDIRRGDKVVTPNGVVEVTSFSLNWKEDFGGKNAPQSYTVTLIGKVNGRQVKMTAPELNTVDVAV